MEDNDKDEYFQDYELNKINEKSKQEIDKINELIRIKEWNIMNDDAILKLEDYRRDVKEELRIVRIILETLKVSEGLMNLDHNIYRGYNFLILFQFLLFLFRHVMISVFSVFSFYVFFFLR